VSRQARTWRVALAAAATAILGSLAFSGTAAALLLDYEFVDEPIPDGGGAAKVTFEEDGLDSLVDLDVLVRVKHAKTRQLVISIKGPDETKVKLSKHDTRGKHLGKGKCFNPPMQSDQFPDFMAFDDEGKRISKGSAPYASGIAPPYPRPSFKPRRRLSVFDGADPNGTWKLAVKDTTPGADGRLICAGLALEDEL
jgi:hypothetical protein